MEKSQLCITCCTVISAISLIFVLFLSGLQHEWKKFKALLVIIVVILLIKFLICDTCKFAIHSLYTAIRQKKQYEQKQLNEATTAYGGVGDAAAADDFKSKRTDFLKLRLASYKSQLFLTEQQSNETLNIHYRQIVNELWLYGKYFVLLLLLIVGSRDPLSYYNTNTIYTILNEGRLNTYSVENVISMPQLYEFIEKVPIEAFINGKGYDDKLISEHGWIQYEIAKLLGVVRLRQIRQKSKKIYLKVPDYDESNYMPKWQLPFKHLRYVNKYWRIYEPWMANTNADFSSYLLSGESWGYLNEYSKNRGYVALLARNVQNSMKVMEYLQNTTWLDERTVVLFIEFTLYNVDANIFSICSLMFEWTPFGNILTDVDVQSAELLLNLDHLSVVSLIVLLLYILVLIQLAKVFFLHAWFNWSILRSWWYSLDLLILVLNFVMLILIVLREASVARMMTRFESSYKVEFIDFRSPATLDSLTSFIAGFLICFTTIRIWRIMQFARVFRLFTRTLFNAKSALASTSLIIFIFLIGFGIASYIINGNNTETFTRFIKGITSLMSFSFGFGHEVDQRDLNYGGFTVGFILYSLLMFGVSIILINMFITLICDYFEKTKMAEDEENRKNENALNFWQFLKLEYACCWAFLKRLRPKHFKRKANETVNESVEKAIDKLERELEKEQQNDSNVLNETAAAAAAETETGDIENEPKHMDRLRHIAKILLTQMEILHRELQILDVELDDDSDEGDQELRYNITPPPSKNGMRKFDLLRVRAAKIKNVLNICRGYLIFIL